ncbi:MAG TPA: type II methionyl aminopeptidase [Candidatus Diapherotrites archaeon]|jgi:methionyl aminopeptidase|nr:type II methionyl aminopeptidase [Candidatus Diapherotrites archaeon]
MNKTEIDILKKSGNINNRAQKLAKKIIKPGISFLEIGTQIENYIKEQDAVPAWPVNLSINHEAAHNSYSPEEQVILKETDVLKVDVGVSIDGYITDSSQTFIFSKAHEKLKESSDKALLKSKDYIFNNPHTVTISKIGEIIEETITSYGYKPVSNLTGHTITRYTTHNQPSIPNIKNNINIKLSDIESWFAIEPFSSTGKGFVTEGNNVYIFIFEEDVSVRNPNARKILEEIKSFNGMAFSEFWVGKELSSFDRKVAFRELLKAQAISAYPVLIDKKDSFVSQAETTFVYDKENKEMIDLININEIIE